MTISRSQLVAGVYTYCGEPPDLPVDQGGLPQSLVFEVLSDTESELLRDLDLSDQNRRVTDYSKTLTANQPEFTINRADFNAAAFVTFKSDSSSDFWYPIDIINRSSLEQAAMDGRMAIAFFGGNRAEVSWLPDSGQSLRIWYDKSGTDPTLDGSTDLGQLYDSYLKKLAAALCMELMGKAPGPVFVASLQRSAEQWKRNISINRQQGMADKAPVWTPARFRGRKYGPIDPRTHFVP